MLFFKECKKILFSLTFIIYSIAVLAMYFSQFHGAIGKPREKPLPGEDSYGTIVREIPEILMPAAIDSLVREYLSGGFSAYPYGFYKYVKLTEKEKAHIAEIISEVSGITPDQLDSFEYFEQGGYYMDENGYMVYLEPNIPEINIPDNLTYEQFRELMREADKIIGGGSMYSDSFIVGNFSRIPKTYEDALAEYDQFINKDKITGAYARLYCDYLGILLAILPVFVAASLTSKDKRSRMEQLVYTRKTSSARLIFTRFFALAAVMLLPLIITAAIAHTRVNGIYSDYAVDSVAFFRYALLWLVPNILTSSAVGMLVTELASGLLAIFVQGVWWIASIFSAMGGLTGGIGKFTLVMRHNSLSGRDVFYAQWTDILFNRSFFTVLSILAIMLTAFLYEQKRRGIINGLTFKSHNKNSKRQSKT